MFEGSSNILWKSIPRHEFLNVSDLPIINSFRTANFASPVEQGLDPCCTKCPWSKGVEVSIMCGMRIFAVDASGVLVDEKVEDVYHLGSRLGTLTLGLDETNLTDGIHVGGLHV